MCPQLFDWSRNKIFEHNVGQCSRLCSALLFWKGSHCYRSNFNFLIWSSVNSKSAKVSGSFLWWSLLKLENQICPGWFYPTVVNLKYNYRLLWITNHGLLSAEQSCVLCLTNLFFCAHRGWDPACPQRPRQWCLPRPPRWCRRRGLQWSTWEPIKFPTCRGYSRYLRTNNLNDDDDINN